MVMYMALSLKKFDKLDEFGKSLAIAQLLSELELEAGDNARMKIFVQLQKYEATHKISSADMFESADCEKRQLDPVLNEWATLYRCYKEIA